MRKQTLWLLTVLMLLLAACGASGEPAASDDDTGTPPAGGETAADPLDGSSWYLHQYGDAATPTDLPSTVEVTIEFAAGQVGGSAGCNSYSGAYSVAADGTLSLDAIAITEMACLEQEKMIVEALYSRGLAAADSFALEGDTLRISYPDGVFLFRTTPPVAGQDALDGTSWYLMAYGPAAEPAGVPGGAQVTASFAAGTISGSAGCNSYSGDYTLEGSTFSTGMLAMTMMACADETVNQLEAAVAGLLQTADTYELGGEFLTLSGPDGVLIFTLTPPEPAFTLGDVRWLYSGIQTGDVVASPVAGTEGFILFDGTQLSGSTGCNSFSGSYTLLDGVFSAGPLATTRMACAEGVDVQEQQILTGLSEATQLSLDGADLRIIFPGGALLFRAGPGGGEATGPAYVRLVNGSPLAMSGILVNFEQQEEGYGDLAPGAVSDYRPVGRAYRYAYVALQADGEPLVLQPIDYVGETPLAPGYHTYILTVAGSTLQLEYVADGDDPAPAPDLNPASALPEGIPGDVEGMVDSGGGIALAFLEGEDCLVAALREELPGEVGVGPCRSQFTGYQLPEQLSFADEDLTDLLNTYIPFAVELDAGFIAFGGRGSSEPTPQVQRMVAAWVRHVADTARGLTTPDPLVVRWSIEGGIAGFCETVTVTDYGLVQRYGSCGGPLGELLSRRFLTADELAPFYAWLDNAAPAEFTLGNLDDPDVVDGMGETFLFQGRGDQPLDEAALQAWMAAVWGDLR